MATRSDQFVGLAHPPVRLNVLRLAHRQIGSFREDARGTIAVMFALLIVPLVGLASLGLEEMQVSSFRQTLQTVAENASQAGAALDEALPERQRREATLAQLYKLLSVARVKPSDVGMRVNFDRTTAGGEIAATVSLEAYAPLAITLLPGRVRKVRVVARSADPMAATRERLALCHAVATQADFESLGC